MTKKEMFARMAKYSLDVQRALAGPETQKM
jgi:hypothetical protein